MTTLEQQLNDQGYKLSDVSLVAVTKTDAQYRPNWPGFPSYKGEANTDQVLVYWVFRVISSLLTSLWVVFSKKQSAQISSGFEDSLAALMKFALT